ncbi:tyrosine-type recombinase/integrase [Polynucleobacter asymbioticus]|uniref:tyrosine-type recombinase/integrase n=1 Tax=Polynucleobacter asymbioticus TaxID=576611 RepID=UPI0008F89E73|nr:integrase family protein [Polynucleobacter asymbioticus]
MSKRKFNFTSQRISAAACEEDKSQTIYWDAATPGLGLRVTPTGSKAFIFETWFDNKSLRVTIGDPKSWTLAAAQAEARRLKVLTDTNIDPREEAKSKRAQESAKRYKGVIALVVWNEYVKERSPDWGDRHKADHADMVRTGGEKITRGLRPGGPKTKQPGILLPILSLPLKEINQQVIKIWMVKEKAKRPTTARRAYTLLKSFLNWAAQLEQYEKLVNPKACHNIALPKPGINKDYLESSQVKDWFAGVKKLNPVVSAYLQVLLLTGARRNEIATMKWSNLDLKWHKATIRDKVDGTRELTLTPYVQSLIQSMQRENEFVFFSANAKSGHLEDPRGAHQKALADAQIKGLSIHGLRRSFRPLSEPLDLPNGVPQQIMGHKPKGTSELHYNPRSLDVLREYHIRIEKHILDHAGVQQPTWQQVSNVIKLVA